MSTTSIEYQRFRARMGMEEETNNPPPKPQKQSWNVRDVLIVIWVIMTVGAAIWVGSGNPEKGLFYCLFWGFVIASATMMTLAGCFARIWLAYHTPEIATNIYRGLSSRR